MSKSLRQRLAARPDEEGTFSLAGHPTDTTPGVDGRSDGEKGLKAMADPLFDLHELLYAEDSRSILLVLQGTDTSGKNGTIKHVVGLVNPAGVRIASFDEPTAAEDKKPFLARIKDEAPIPGRLTVFNRSHYEDAVTTLVEGEIDAKIQQRRIGQILDFEQNLVDEGTVIVKCFLHLSYDEQRDRLLRRLRRDDKRWKFKESDLETRTKWDDYQSEYGRVIGQTSPEWAPWLIIPSDHKWYRNWAIATILVETLESMNLAYPQPDLDIEAIRQRLEPPH